jgi:hypothetical protein
MKRILTVVSIGMALILLIPAVALAYTWHIDFTVTETGGTSYTSLPLYGLVNNSYLAANGYIAATGLNTRVYASDNSVLPHMLSEDKTWFVTPQPALNSQVVTYALGDTAVSSFKVIPGYSGNITTADDATLELGSVFDISISGYFDTSAGSDKNILYKSGACKLNVSAASAITFHALNADNTDNWTMVANPVATGSHTVRIYANGFDAYLYLDGVQEDSESMVAMNLFTADAALTGTYYNPYNRTTFYAAGRYWAFYLHNSKINYTTSTTGAAWEARVEISANVLGASAEWSMWFDGTSVYYAQRDDTRYILFRKGTPESDGTITWAAAEQSIDASPVFFGVASCSIAVASDGHAQIAYWETRGGSIYNMAIRNSNTDGTWATTGGYPVNVFNHSSTNMPPTIIADYDSDDMYMFIVQGSDNYLRGYYFNGAAWSGTADVWGTITVATLPAGVSAAFESDDDIVAAWVNGTTQNLFNVRFSGGGMGTQSSFGTFESNSAPSLTFDSITGITFVYWIDGTSDDLYYKTYTDGTWGSDTLLAAGTLDRAVCSPTYRFNAADSIGIADSFNSSIYHAYMAWDWAWLDNANSWSWMTNNSMSYADNMTMAVSGVTHLLYRPDSIIVGTTLPDESGNGNDGTFSWGTNPADVDVVPGPLASDVDVSEPEEAAAPWKLIPTVPGSPSGLFTDGGEGMLGLAELGDASEATGNPREMFIIIVAFLLAVLIGFAVYGATHNAKMGVKGSVLLQSISSLVVMIFFYVGGGGVIPGWVLIPFGIEAFFIMLWRNPQHSAT